MKAVCLFLASVFLCLVYGEIIDGENDKYDGRLTVGEPLVFAMNENDEIDDLFNSPVLDRNDGHSEGSSGGTGDNDNGHNRRKKRSTSFSAEEIQGIVDKHNLLREQVSPEASNMEFMNWNDALASMAQEWSNKCVFEHGNPENVSPFSSVGQNLWRGGGSEDNQPNGIGATQYWFSEEKHYNYDANNCSDVCGHYTQVVWASSYAVGCGRTFCPLVHNVGKKNSWIITCNYGPAGNYEGERPYLNGNSCTQCASGVGQCYENKCRLCSEHSEHCECKAVCKNCGTLNNDDCTCTCRDGWYGSYCSNVCEDTDENCGSNPGWPFSWCSETYPFVLEACPLFCELCDAPDPSQTCDNNLAQGSWP